MAAYTDFPSLPLPCPLSPREQEVAALVARGYSNSQIGQDLAISVRTVESHLSSAMRKTGAESRLDLALLALTQGWASWEAVRLVQARASRNRQISAKLGPW